MGFLSVNGMLLTFDEYKELVGHYKVHGLLQFIKLFNIHKDRELTPAQLHWGEEIEYHLYSLRSQERRVALSCDANDVI